MTSTTPRYQNEGEVAHSTKWCDRFEWTVHDYIDKVVNSHIESPGFLSDGALWHMALRTKVKSETVESFTLNLWRTPVSGVRCQVRVGLKSRTGNDFGVISCQTDADGFLEVRKFLLWSTDKKKRDHSARHHQIPGERLTVFCELCRSGKSKETLKTDDSATSVLIQNFRDLCVSGANSDLELKVEDRIFKAHKAIVGARCPVFASMFQHDMKENNSGVVDITDCSADAFEVYLTYLYTGQMEERGSGLICNLYYIADKYDCQELKERCVRLLNDCLSVDNFCDVVAMALRHGESGLLVSACEFFIRNVKLIIKTVKWQKYLSENPIHANELYIKAIDAQTAENCVDSRVP